MRIIVIVGPTGVGKTKMSISLAKYFNAEIINADSMQVYKDLNIGTAKITDDENEGIPHHLLNIRDVTDEYSVYDFQNDGRKVLDDLVESNRNVIIVGGTGLYIKALLYDYNFDKEYIKDDYSDFTNEELYNKIIELNPNTNVHINNRKRLERTLQKISNGLEDTNNGNKLLYDATFIGLTTDRNTLYDKINDRVDNMIQSGLINEVKNLYDKGIKSKAIMTGIGYKELYLYFDGKIKIDNAIELIKKNSRHYAKRQYTWFNNKMNITWFNVDYNNFDNTINDVIKYLN